MNRPRAILLDVYGTVVAEVNDLGSVRELLRATPDA